MSKDLNEEVHTEDNDKLKQSLFNGWTYKDYIVFWLQTIQTYCEDGKTEDMEKDKANINPVILIASHHDCIKKKAEQNNAQNENINFYDKVEKCLPKKQTLKRHISPQRYHEIECPQRVKLNEKQSDAIEIVRKCIVSTARTLVHWGEKIPVKWTVFELFIRENKERKILSRKELINRKEFQCLKDTEISDMLRYFKEIGLIIYFAEKGLKENIIVDVQWFVDAFKYIITDPNHAHPVCKSVQEWEVFMNTGMISDSTLVKVWRENSLYNSKKDIIIPYMEKLGILAKVQTQEVTGREIAINGKKNTDPVYYIPSINKTEMSKERMDFMNNVNKTPILVFCFKQYIPHFFFFRLVAICFSKWEPLSDYHICKNIAFYKEKGGDRNIAIAVNKTSIQLQVFTPDKEIQLKSEKTKEIRNHVENMINNITTTFHRKALYEIGYPCKDINITEEDSNYFLSERTVANLETNKRICPISVSSSEHDQHKIVRDELLHYWYNVHK